MPQFKYLIVPVLSIGLLLSSCAADRSFGMASGIEVAQLESLPTPSNYSAYTLKPQEKIDISVMGVDALSGSYFLSSAGILDFPLIGPVALAGKTPSEAAALVARRLDGEYVLSPDVTVTPENLPIPSISIGGQVENPGSYSSSTSPTLLWLVNNAGGLSEYAKLEDVLVIRRVDGRKYIGVYNIGAIQRGNYDDPAVYSGDTIIVGDSPSRRSLDTILDLVPVVSSSIILIDRVGR